MLTLTLPEMRPPVRAAKDEVLLVTNADLRESANVNCWPVQQQFEARLTEVLRERFGVSVRRAHPIKPDKGHGFISTQREGSDVFAGIDPEAPVIVLLTAWQYSHHLAPSLAQHRGPILLLANFEGTWPGLVGMLCMAGTLTSLGKDYSRLWSVAFDDEFFYRSLGAWLKTGSLNGARNLAGYVLGPDGRRRILVMMINHTKAGAAGKSQDALLEWAMGANGKSPGIGAGAAENQVIQR